MIVVGNCRRVLSALPHNSPIKRELAARLTDTLPKDKAAELAHYSSTKSIERGRKEVKEAESDHDDGGEEGKEEKKSTLMMSYTPHTTKERISKEEQEAVEQWLKDTCPKQSGSQYYFQRCSHAELYEQYNQAMEQDKVQWKGKEKKQAARCRDVFDRWKKGIHIRSMRRYTGHFECIKCSTVGKEQDKYEQLLREAKADEENKQKQVDVVKQKEKLTKINKHINLRRHQSDYLYHIRYNAIKQNHKRALLTMDFSKFNMYKNVGGGTEGKDQPEWVHDLVMVLEYHINEAEVQTCYTAPTPTPPIDEQKPPPDSPSKISSTRTKKKQKEKHGELQRRVVSYKDWLCDNPGIESNDVEYVRTALKKTIASGWLDGFERIDLFTDGGGKHFK